MRGPIVQNRKKIRDERQGETLRDIETCSEIAI